MSISRGLLSSIFGGAAGAGQWAGQRKIQNIGQNRFAAEDAWRRDEPVRQAAMAAKQLEIRADFENRAKLADEARAAEQLAGNRKVWQSVLTRMPGATPEDLEVGTMDRDAFDKTYERLRAPKIAPTQNIDPLSSTGISAAAQRAAAVARAEAPFKASAQPKARALPSSAVEKLVGIDNMLGMATDVRDALQRAVKENTDVTGRVGGVIPTPGWVKNLTGKGGTEGTDTRALIGNLYGTVAKERGGSALSATEIRLLESYMPSENDDERTATIKANRFIRTLRGMRENKLKAYQQFGFGVDDEAPMADQMEYSPNNPFAPTKRP